MGAVRKNDSKIEEIANSLESSVEKVLSFVKKNTGKKFDLKIYDDFWKTIYDYYTFHLCVKYIVDYLSPEELKRYLPALEKARLAAEPVFHDQEIFMEEIAEQVTKETGLSRDLVLCTNREELRDYFNGAKLPKKQTLEERFIEGVQFFNLEAKEIFSGEKAIEVENIILPKADENGIKGQIAYQGKVSGRVRIVIDPLKYKGGFDDGDILVTGMTRPEFLPLMKKASAFVTDAGGILSHAAIVAREMKKPCVIGTQIATKTFKDGDLVEVDANKGVVKILKKK